MVKIQTPKNSRDYFFVSATGVGAGHDVIRIRGVEGTPTTTHPAPLPGWVSKWQSVAGHIGCHHGTDEGVAADGGAADNRGVGTDGGATLDERALLGGVARLAAWYRENRERAREIATG